MFAVAAAAVARTSSMLGRMRRWANKKDPDLAPFPWSRPTTSPLSHKFAPVTSSSGTSRQQQPGQRQRRESHRQVLHRCSKVPELADGFDLADEYWSQLVEKSAAQLGQKGGEVYPTGRRDPIIVLANVTEQQQQPQQVRGGQGELEEEEVVEEPFAFCTIPKNGCSRWRRFLRRVQGIEDYMSYPHDYATNGLLYPSDFLSLPSSSVNNETYATSNQMSSSLLFDDPHMLRVAIVRDPLSRLLSAWLEKIHNSDQPWNRRMPDACTATGAAWREDFPTFVKCMHADTQQKQQVPALSARGRRQRHLRRTRDPCSWDEHFAPQTCKCHLRTMKYDLLVSVEGYTDWFRPLLQCLGVEPYARNYLGDGADFGSDKANRRVGSEASGASNKLCDYYTPESYQLARSIYAGEELFMTSGWDYDTACGMQSST